MAKGYCQHGCYPVDERWHGGGLKDGDGNAINNIFEFREAIREVQKTEGRKSAGAEAAEGWLQEHQPADEPYVMAHTGPAKEQESIEHKKKLRKISMSNIGQGFDIGAHLNVLDRAATFYRYHDPITVKDWIRTSPQSQIHQEMTQRRQQAEQQINRVLSNLSDLYEQKQLLEHDQRRLEERAQHFDATEEHRKEGGGYEDELKADFVDLVDQHTGRHSILQMQANNVFPSITADFYQMSGLDDLKDGGLKDLPENEKAVLRKKWKLYEQWKGQFETAVTSRLNDVERQLKSVQTSIEQTQKWLQPYVEDMQRIQPEGQFDEELHLGQIAQMFTPHGYSNMYRLFKTLTWIDRSPGQKSGKYYDVVSFEPIHIVGAGLENPQAPGQGLVIFSMGFWEYFCCKHVFDEVFQPQVDARQNQVQRYISRYIGEDPDIEGHRGAVIERYSDVTTDEEEEKLAEAESVDELHDVEISINQRLNSTGRRMREKVKGFFGMSDDFYHEKPKDLRRNLLGPFFPTQFYLDYKYDNDLYVMK